MISNTHAIFFGFDVHQRFGHVPSTLCHCRDILVQKMLSSAASGCTMMLVMMATRRGHVIRASSMSRFWGRSTTERGWTAKKKKKKPHVNNKNIRHNIFFGTVIIVVNCFKMLIVVKPSNSWKNGRYIEKKIIQSL